MKSSAFLPLCALAACAAAPFSVHSQSYPSKPIRVVSDSASGSPGDVALRLVAQKMNIPLGQPVIVEPRTGAGGQIAAAEVIRTGMDGHTILYSSSQILVSKFLLKTMRIDVQKDLAPISQAARGNNFVVAHKSVPAGSLKDLIEYARRNPGKLTFSSNGIGSSLHIQWVGFMLSTGTDLLHVPYGAGNNSLRLADFFAGRTSVVMTPLGSMKRQMEAGDVKVLAMMSEERNKYLPEVPAIGELVPNYKFVIGFWGFWGAGGLAQPIAMRLSEEVRNGLSDPDVIAKLGALDIKPVSSTPQEFARAIAGQLALLKELTTEAGITPQ